MPFNMVVFVYFSSLAISLPKETIVNDFPSKPVIIAPMLHIFEHSRSSLSDIIIYDLRTEVKLSVCKV